MPRLSWEANALDQRSKARIRMQAIESWFDLEHRHLPVSRLEGLLKPFERSIRIDDTHEGGSYRKPPEGFA
jgi:hypothetical protein